MDISNVSINSGSLHEIFFCVFSRIVIVFSYRYYPEEHIVTYPYRDTYTAAYKYEVEIKNIPHHVLIFYNRYYCSGSLIGSKTVVTAATCFHKKEKDDKIFVKVGAGIITDPDGKVILADSLKIHEFYKRISEVDNDIALVFLKEHAPLGTNVTKIMLVDSGVPLLPGTNTQVSGYGYLNLNATKYMRKLLLATFFVLGKNCPSNIKHMITHSTYCAKYLPDARLSDNGGGAIFRDILVGILVAGGQNKKPPNVAIFTNVSYFHDWIELNIKQFLKKNCVPPKQDEESADINDEEN